MDRVLIRLPELIYVIILSLIILPTVQGQSLGECDINYYQCANRQCVHMYHVCDGISDCLDNSDETTPSPCSSQALEYFTDDYLVVADNVLGGLYQVQMSTGSVRHLRVPAGIYPIAVKMDPVNKNVYWTDVLAKTINRYSMISHTTSVIYRDQTNLAIYDGLELDLENGIIYLSDARPLYPGMDELGGNGSIIAIDISGNFRRTVTHMAGMRPRALALDKANRMLYWTDWGVPGIYKISLTTIGVQPTAIVTQGLIWPNAFVVDFQNRVIFWGDAGSKKIEMSNLDGTNRRVIIQEQDPHYFAMTMTSSYVYFTDWKAGYVRRFDRYTYQFQYYSSQVFQRLNGIAYYQSGGSSGSGSTSTSTSTPTPKNNLSSLTTGPNQESKPGLSTTHIIIVVVIVVGVVLIAAIVTCGIVFVTVKRRQKKKRNIQPAVSRDSQVYHIPADVGGNHMSPTHYTSLHLSDEDKPVFNPGGGYYEITQLQDLSRPPPYRANDVKQHQPPKPPPKPDKSV